MASLAILCGGRATRLGGVPKGLIRVEERTCLERLLALDELFEDVFLVGAPPGGGFAQVRCVSDVILGRGAPGGVYAALVHARTPWVVAVACDMPFVSPAVVQHLLSLQDAGWDATCFEVGGFPEPLLALYRTAAAPQWKKALAKGPSFKQLYTKLRARILPEAELAKLDPSLKSVVSLNTPQDLARWAAVPPDVR